MKTSEATRQQLGLVPLSPSGDAEESATARTGRRRSKDNVLDLTCAEHVGSVGCSCLRSSQLCEGCHWRLSSTASWKGPAHRQATGARFPSWVQQGGSSEWTVKAHAGTWIPRSIQVISALLKLTWKLLTKYKISLLNFRNKFYEERAATHMKTLESIKRICHAIWSESSATEHGGYLNMQ